MLPDIPVFNRVTHFLSGKFLNLLCKRIKAQTPIAGAGVDLEETADGLIIKSTASVTPASSELTYGFQVVMNSPTSARVSYGLVFGTTWGTPDWDDPVPVDWLFEMESDETDFTVATGDSIWLKVTLTKTDENLEGPLPTTGATALSVTPGGGGAGGGGAGGGAGGDLAVEGNDGSAGGDGTGGTGGTGGDGGVGGGSPGEGDGNPGPGGAGGAGSVGALGQTISWNHYTKLKMRARTYSLNNVTLEKNSSTLTGDATTIYVRLASIASGVATQHHAGNYHITPPTFSFIV